MLKKVGNQPNIPTHYFECDEVSDLSSIDVTYAPMGSRCYVINTGQTFALNSNKQWKAVPTGSSGGSGGSGGDTPGTGGSDIYYDGGEEY